MITEEQAKDIKETIEFCINNYLKNAENVLRTRDIEFTNKPGREVDIIVIRYLRDILLDCSGDLEITLKRYFDGTGDDSKDK